MCCDFLTLFLGFEMREFGNEVGNFYFFFGIGFIRIRGVCLKFIYYCISMGDRFFFGIFFFERIRESFGN